MYEHFNGKVGINLTYHTKKDIQDQLTEGSPRPRHRRPRLGKAGIHRRFY